MKNSDPQHLRTEGDINISPARTAWQSGITDEATRNWLEKDSRYFLHQSLSTPCLDVLGTAQGSSIRNLAGKDYLDFHGNNVHQLGYANAFLLDRVKAQLDELAFSPRRFTNIPAINLAERLVGLTNGVLSRSLFAPGGTSAMSMALKLARIATGRYKTISLYDAFHGASMDSISVGGEYLFSRQVGPLLPGSIHVPPPDSYRGMWYDQHRPDGDLPYADYIEYVIEKEGDIGAIVAETIRSTVVQVPSKAYWQRIRELCNRHGILLILDEVPVCMGRTGTHFAYQQFGIEPDILVIGKGLGAGLVPMAALLCRETLNVAGHVSLGHFTHEKNPLGSAAALAALDYMDQHQTLQQVKTQEAYLRQKLNALKDQCPVIGDVRGLGMLWGIELVEDRTTKKPAVQLAEQVLYACLEAGLSLKVSGGNVLSLYPPLVISQAELDRALGILQSALEASWQTS
ncbi:MAG: aspartate aminotransferase family protein [Candidatus Pseudobacter hemicellulosilyticus]|uniref:Aspartate aminotransferase family protein n=1 Tax=Candidatus Pseudobacter hemicellulosilyticus TaxID=3121375 RepID=A0AAJ5WLU2_9BACT|nr:MAG: aspartate aminotransferase family protein [Pseudobacter sp.]